MSDTPASPASSIKVPKPEQLENFDALPEAEQQDVMEQILDIQSVTAEASLKSVEGYDILKELYRSSAELVLLTSEFVIPVSNNMAAITEHLSDPEAFRKSFATLLNDIKKYRDDLAVLWNCHKDRSGAPDETELTDVFALADGYNKLLTRFDTVITPLLDVLKTTLAKEYSPVLEQQVNG